MKKKEMLKLKRWAVVGATQNKKAFGYQMFKTLKDNGYTVYPVTPKYEEIDGVKAYKSIKDITDEIDIVGFIVNPKVGFSIIEDVIDLGIKNIWMQPGTRDPQIVKKAVDNNVNVTFSCVMNELSESN